MKRLIFFLIIMLSIECKAQSDSLVKVTENLYMITGLGGNVSFLVNNEGVLLVDAGTSRQSGKVISRIIKSVTPLPIKYLIYTQYHVDHTLGACGLEDKPLVIGHVNLTKNLERYNKQWFDNNYNAMDHQIMILKNKVDSLTLSNHPNLASAKKMYTEGLNEIEDFKKSFFVRPDITFNDQFTIYFGSDTIKLSYPKSTHTDCSILVEFTNKNILATGDILFNEFFPFIDTWANSNTMNWINTAKNIQKKNYKYLIPGHGNLTNTDAMNKQAQFLSDLRAEVKAAMQKGLSIEQMQSIIKLPLYTNYGFPDLLKVGIKAVYEELLKENS